MPRCLFLRGLSGESIFSIGVPFCEVEQNYPEHGRLLVTFSLSGCRTGPSDLWRFAESANLEQNGQCPYGTFWRRHRHILRPCSSVLSVGGRRTDATTVEIPGMRRLMPLEVNLPPPQATTHQRLGAWVQHGGLTVSDPGKHRQGTLRVQWSDDLVLLKALHSHEQLCLKRNSVDSSS